MGKETLLKKPFDLTNVKRLRNLIQNKFGDKTTQGIGYTKLNKIHEEGDEWEENGRSWIIKNGIKQNITKLDNAKKINLMPLFCPKCSHLMKGNNDKSFYNIHKICFNCVVDFEFKLKQEGKLEEYLNSIHNDQIDNLIKEFKNWIKEIKNEGNESFITEAGDIEEWLGGNNNEENEILKAIEYLKQLKR